MSTCRLLIMLPLTLYSCVLQWSGPSLERTARPHTASPAEGPPRRRRRKPGPPVPPSTARTADTNAMATCAPAPALQSRLCVIPPEPTRCRETLRTCWEAMRNLPHKAGGCQPVVVACQDSVTQNATDKRESYFARCDHIANHVRSRQARSRNQHSEKDNESRERENNRSSQIVLRSML